MDKRRVICILVAATKDGGLFYLIRPYAKEELAIIKKSSQFYCPVCGSSVIMKIGEVKLPHFSHKSLSRCDSYSEPESSLHLQGKNLLFQFFKSQNLPVELEKYLPAIRQRADLLVDGHIAVEFQCSSIPASQIAGRSNGYSRLGMSAIWIGGLAEPIIEGIQKLKLTGGKKEMFRQKQKNPYLLLFMPEENRFYYLSNLIYISGSQWIGKVKSLAASKQQYPFAVPKRMTLKEFEIMYCLFYQSRKKFVSSQVYAKNRVQNPFWRSCYELRLDVRDLPDAIGVPMKNAEFILCNAVLWQLQAVEGARKGMSAASLVQSGKLPVHPSFRAEAETLIKSYLSVYDMLKEQRVGEIGFLNLLYDFHCKTL
ncbi:competence protein CoiA [Planomicrobium sp. CPCC 101110]|uniref:competence protein CoiA n=1 Tax=Planomicrobium sp. CPCC 101110 TaxID=2599619 RepID=UPI0011B5C9DA|nr:competence protein CoiA family protein [Planomicrobium sp. CPCC 101110]TWT27988.1 competence protein CoiA [Planomicrobium sp. CPCC 101110]